MKRALKRQKKFNLKKKSFDFGFLEKIKFLKRRKSFDFGFFWSSEKILLVAHREMMEAATIR